MKQTVRLYSYKTDVLSTEPHRARLGTCRTTIKYFTESKHFEIERTFITLLEDETGITNADVLRRGKGYVVYREGTGISQQGALRMMGAMVDALERYGE